MKRMLRVGVAAMAVWAVAAPGEGQPSVGRREGSQTSLDRRALPARRYAHLRCF